MKRMNIKHGLLLFVVFLYGCLPSLQPLYTDETIVFDEALLGKWYDDSGGSWSFTRGSENQYSLRVYEIDPKEARFEVHLVQIGDHRFIDLFPGQNIDLKNTPDIYHQNLVAAHTFMKLDLSEPNLLLQWVYFGDLIEKEPEILKHEKQNGDVVLITAETKDMQMALIENLEEVLDGDPGILRKCPVDFSCVNTLFDQNLLGQWESVDGGLLDIIAVEDGYDILFSDCQSLHTVKGVLYDLNGRPVMGLYYIADASKESGPDMDLPPDELFLVECDGHQLKIRGIKWKQVPAFMADSSTCSVERSGPYDVFLRISD